MRIKNWNRFQHYNPSDRKKPGWIKLYHDLLDDPEWHRLSGKSAKGLILLWLVASEDNGFLPDNNKLAFRLRTTELDVEEILNEINEHWLCDEEREPIEEWASRYVSSQLREEILKRDDHQCRVCADKENLEIDHIIPVSRGGDGSAQNLQTLCRSCNRKKRARVGSVQVPPSPTQPCPVLYIEENKKEEEKRIRNTSSHDDGGGDIQTAFNEWNVCAENLSLAKAERLTTGRKNKLRACLKENGLQGWRRALENLSRLPFCLGEGERGWRANLDFLLQPSSFQKVLEMAFGGGTGPPAQMSRLQQATLANLQEIAGGKFRNSNGNGGGSIRSQAPRLVYAATTGPEDDAQNNHPEADRPSDVAAREID